MSLTYYRLLERVGSNINMRPVIFEDFNDALDAIEEEARRFTPHFVAVDRDVFSKMPNKRNVYHQIGDNRYLALDEVNFVPKKPKFDYQYTVAITTGEKGRKSPLYATFDEMYDAVNAELTQLHKSIGLNWNDPETQKACRKDWGWSVTNVDYKQALDKFPSVQFADFTNNNRTERFYLERVAKAKPVINEKTGKMSVLTMADAIKFRNDYLATRIPHAEEVKKYMDKMPSIETVRVAFLQGIKREPFKNNFEVEIYVHQTFGETMNEDIRYMLQQKIHEKYKTSFPDCEFYNVQGSDLATYFMMKMTLP